MRFARPLLALACVALIVFAIARTFQVRRPDRPAGTWEQIASLHERDDLNVVMLVVDTLRADRLSAYGYERETSPILEAMAGTGVRFENTLAQSSWTKTSMASMMTGTYPAKNRITRFEHSIPRPATLASEIFQEQGFRTVGIYRNGWVAPSFGFDQGYDYYYKPIVDSRPRNALQKNPSAHQLAGTDQGLVAAAGEFLRTVRDERFFLYLHFMDLHQYVYDQSADFGTTYSDIYDNSVRWIDANLGTVVALLQREGLMKRTVLVVVSDHGEAFREHGTEGHAQDLYEEVTRVPFVMMLPFRLPEPVVVETPVENVDVWPTVLDLLGLPALPEADGESLVPLIEAAARGEEPTWDGDGDESLTRFAHLDQTWGRSEIDPRPLVTVQEGRYRLHQVLAPGGRVGELYDVRADPTETVNLAAERPEEVKRLLGLVKEYIETPPPSWGLPENVELGEMELVQLRALGYVVDPHAPPEERAVDQRLKAGDGYGYEGEDAEQGED